MIACRECGLQLSDGARFCRACGTPVTGEQPAAGGPRPDPDGGYWAAVGRAGAERTAGRPSPAPTATAVVPPPHGSAAGYGDGPPVEPARRRAGWVVLAVLVALVVLAAATYVGYQLTREDPVDEGGERPATTEPAGPSRRLAPEASATCTASTSKDGLGNVTTYEPRLVNDGDPATAWRCDGTGIDEALTLRFDQPVHLDSVGLIPGIVKLDPGNGTDRWLQNDRTTMVVWTFDDGSVEQRFDDVRELQTKAVDVTTRTVTMRILRVIHGEDVEDRNGETQRATGKTPIAEVELRGRATA